MQLWHVSDDPNIEMFEPRPPKSANVGVTWPAVWAVGEARLENYLVPRNCPRICIRPGPETTAADRAQFFGLSTAPAVVIIETPWWERALAARLWKYMMPAAAFELVEASACYYASRHAVIPLAVQAISNPLDALLARGVELRVVPRLKPLVQTVAASSLTFSMIRMGHAAG